MNFLFYVLVIICSTIAGMGIGGGSIFLLICPMFVDYEYTILQIYNLIMFICVGISASIYNIKNKNIDIKMFKKIILFVLIGSVIGVFLNKNTDKIFIQKIFLVFMSFLGIYEIISSLKNIKNHKLKNDERS